MSYPKLIRDKIPDIILASGKQCHFRKMTHQEFLISLNEKLREELEEFYESGDISELVDMVEVIYTIIINRGLSLEAFEKLRLQKRTANGGYEDKLLLISVTD